MTINEKILDTLDFYTLKEASDFISLKINSKFQEDNLKSLVKNNKIKAASKLDIYVWTLISEEKLKKHSDKFSPSEIDAAIQKSPIDGYAINFIKEQKIQGVYYFSFTENNDWYITSLDGKNIFVPFENHFYYSQIIEPNVQDNAYPPEPSKWIFFRSDLMVILDMLLEIKDDKKESEDDKPYCLLTIAALLEVLKNHSGKNHTQSSIISAIKDAPSLENVEGISERTLQEAFRHANKALKEARKK